MFNRTINNNIDAKDDWETKYDPSLVGEYLLWHNKQNPFDPGDVISMKPGQIIPMPSPPTLHDFLRWVARKDGDGTDNAG